MPFWFLFFFKRFIFFLLEIFELFFISLVSLKTHQSVFQCTSFSIITFCLWGALLIQTFMFFSSRSFFFHFYYFFEMLLFIFSVLSWAPVEEWASWIDSPCFFSLTQHCQIIPPYFPRNSVFMIISLFPSFLKVPTPAPPPPPPHCYLMIQKENRFRSLLRRVTEINTCRRIGRRRKIGQRKESNCKVPSTEASCNARGTSEDGLIRRSAPYVGQGSWPSIPHIVQSFSMGCPW